MRVLTDWHWWIYGNSRACSHPSAKGYRQLSINEILCIANHYFYTYCLVFPQSLCFWSLQLIYKLIPNNSGVESDNQMNQTAHHIFPPATPLPFHTFKKFLKVPMDILHSRMLKSDDNLPENKQYSAKCQLVILNQRQKYTPKFPLAKKQEWPSKVKFLRPNSKFNFAYTVQCIVYTGETCSLLSCYCTAVTMEGIGRLS